MNSAAAICLSGVIKRYGDVAALSGVDLTVQRATTTALIGPSGCGKTTLLRLMNGLVAPDTGQVWVLGTALLPNALQTLRLRMGYVIQDGGLFPHLSARSNVVLMARHLRWPEQRITTRLEQLCALTRLPSSALDRYPSQLSGGQRQRVALMRALMLEPELLLLDEPLAALDPLVRRELQEDLAAIFRALQQTVVIVTHDLAEAAFFAPHLVLLRGGRIVQQGPIAALIGAPAEPFVADFVRAQRPLAWDEAAP